MRRLLTGVVFIFLLAGMCNVKAGNPATKTDRQFVEYITAFTEALKAGNKEQVLSMISFPLVLGTGGDAFYSYESVNFKDFAGNYYDDYIVAYSKKLLKMKGKKFKTIVKKGNNIAGFNFGMDSDGNPDGTDHASMITDGTVVYCFETCEGRAGACVGYFFSKFGDDYKLWGITYGR